MGVYVNVYTEELTRKRNKYTESRQNIIEFQMKNTQKFQLNLNDYKLPFKLFSNDSNVEYIL